MVCTSKPHVVLYFYYYLCSFKKMCTYLLKESQMRVNILHKKLLLQENKTSDKTKQVITNLSEKSGT